MRKWLGFLAVAGLLAIAAPTHRAEAAVMAPGVASTVQGATESLATEVRWRRRGYYAPRRYYARRYYAPRRYYGPRVYVPRVRFY